MLIPLLLLFSTILSVATLFALYMKDIPILFPAIRFSVMDKFSDCEYTPADWRSGPLPVIKNPVRFTPSVRISTTEDCIFPGWMLTFPPPSMIVVSNPSPIRLIFFSIRTCSSYLPSLTLITSRSNEAYSASWILEKGRS